MREFSTFGHGDIDDYVVSNTNLMFVDRESRIQELSVLSEYERMDVCDIGWLEGNVDYATYDFVPPSYSSEGIETPFKEGEGWDGMAGFFSTLVHGTVHHKYLDYPDSGELLLRLLKNYAEKGVDLGPEFGFNNSHYHLSVAFIGYIRAWQAIKDEEFVTSEDKTLIESYFANLTEPLLIPQGYYDTMFNAEISYTTAEIDNHQWSTDLSMMAYGIHTGNNHFFRLGIKRLFAILASNIREDGSHTVASQRGGSSLLYSIASTSIMIQLAELAYNQGYDLYDKKIDGISLNDVIAFHVTALIDNSLLIPYNLHLEGKSGPEYCEDDTQCINWNNYVYSDDNPGGFRYSDGWGTFEAYRKRFPNSALVTDYLGIIPDETVPSNLAQGPMIQSCEYRDYSN